MDIPDQKVSATVSSEARMNLNKVGAPLYIDWREFGVVTSVKDQGECGCCWSFATCALAESSLIMKGLATRSIDLSEQFLLSCTPDSDCEGGYIEYALRVAAQKGIPLDSKYPYNPYRYQSGICQNVPNVEVTTKAPLSYYNLRDNDIKSLLTLGPLAIALSATNWEYYDRGIWRCSPSDKVNHAVLLVGYTADGQAWIVKNQWGTDWGENGYIYISTNPNYNCKIGTAVHMLSSSLFTQVALLVIALLAFLSL